MKLDRDENPDGKGKYALLNLRKNVIEWGEQFGPDEFFVIKLKDKYAQAALLAYAQAAREDGEHEWAREIEKMASRSGEASPFCKKPD